MPCEWEEMFSNERKNSTENTKDGYCRFICVIKKFTQTVNGGQIKKAGSELHVSL